MDEGESQLRCTVEFVFAPEEQDVYSYECPLKDLAPSGAKLGSVTFAGACKAIALLGSSGVNETVKAIDISLSGAKRQNTDLLHFQVEFAISHFPLKHRRRSTGCSAR
jgi:hypothetical protein